jgi:hypothetical protein
MRRKPNFQTNSNVIATELIPVDAPLPAPKKKLLSVASAAVILDRTPKAIRRLLDKGILTPIRIDGRVQIDPDEIDALIAKAKAESMVERSKAAQAA